MPQNLDASGLYGITGDNSNRSGEDFWSSGKLNSALALSLCLYMRDADIPGVPVMMKGGKIGVTRGRADMGTIFGRKDQNPSYEFEKSFAPYERFSSDRSGVDKIDLVVSLNGSPHSAFEMKATVVPDHSTASDKAKDQAPEIVIRPVSSAYAMMRLALTLLHPEYHALRHRVLAELSAAYGTISNWENEEEISRESGSLRESLRTVLGESDIIQRPFLIQSIWKTKGMSLDLCDNCFDIFVWSDVAVMGIPLEEHDEEKGRRSLVSRTLRETARHVRSLHDILRNGHYDYSRIFKGMALGNQTDKSFSINGRRSIKYLSCKRLIQPALCSSVIEDIILDGSLALLRPERRLDTALQHYIATRWLPTLAQAPAPTPAPAPEPNRTRRVERRPAPAEDPDPADDDDFLDGP